MNKRLLILTCFFSMLTLISSVICSSLVFYNETARTEVNSNKVIASNNIYKSTSIIYNNNNTISLSGINPGYSLEQSFVIINNNSNTIKYNLEWQNVVTTWNVSTNNMETHPEEFVYSINCTNGEKVENKTMPVSENDYIILKDLDLKTNKTNECTIRITFLNKGVNQSYNLNKSFKGTYKVVITE